MVRLISPWTGARRGCPFPSSTSTAKRYLPCRSMAPEEDHRSIRTPRYVASRYSLPSWQRTQIQPVNPPIPIGIAATASIKLVPLSCQILWAHRYVLGKERPRSVSIYPVPWEKSSISPFSTRVPCRECPMLITPWAHSIPSRRRNGPMMSDRRGVKRP